DVRDAAQLRAALDNGLAEFGKLDIVVAQAGVAGMQGKPPLQAWCDVINTNLIGTINAIQVALSHLGEGGSIIATGSTSALMDTSKKDVPGNDRGGMAYVHSKRALASYVHDRQLSWPRWGFALTSSTRRTATPRCCRASRCTARSGRTSTTRHKRTPSRF